MWKDDYFKNKVGIILSGDVEFKATEALPVFWKNGRGR